MKRLQFVSIILGCFLILVLVFSFLAQQQARTAANATFSTIIFILQVTPSVLILALIIRFSRDFLDITQHFFLTKKSAYEAESIKIENENKKNIFLLPEGSSALVRPSYGQFSQVYNPRAPRIQKVVDVSQEQEQLALPEHIPDMFTLEMTDALTNPSAFYVGKTATDDVAPPMGKTYHGVITAPSGKGKSNVFQSFMAQAVKKGCQTYFISPMANNVKMLEPDDPRKVEVWAPIFERLAEPPKKEIEEIEDLLAQLAQEIKNRVKQEGQGDGSWRRRPLYVFIDELPLIFDASKRTGKKTAIDDIRTIAASGRQMAVHAFIAAQGAQVQTIGINTDTITNFGTVLYGGGSNQSSRNVLGRSATNEEERILFSQKGLWLTKAYGLHQPVFVRAGLMTNEFLFDYLGCGPFVLEKWFQERPYSIQQDYTPGTQRDASFEIETAPEYSLGLAGLQNGSTSPVEKVEVQKKERYQRSLKNDEKTRVIYAIATLEHEQEPLTLNAIRTRANVSWPVDDEIKSIISEMNKTLSR